MASSFHWTDTDIALREFNRILKDTGSFVALWNPRNREKSVIETRVQDLLENKYKVSSKRSGFSDRLRDVLKECGFFSDVIYMDATDVFLRTPEEYIGAWRSVSDVRAELGEENFHMFLIDLEIILKTMEQVEVHCQTRAWIGIK